LPRARRVPDADDAADRTLLDLDRAGPDLEQMAQLAHQRQCEDEIAAEPAEEDVCQRRPLALVASGIDVQEELPRRAGLVLAVLDHRAEPAECDVPGMTLGDEPGEDAQADPVGRAAAGHAADHAAGTDRVAVAGLEIGARDPVGEHY
jgi:hypothetical protein